jgi:hypothetical protein
VLVEVGGEEFPTTVSAETPQLIPIRSFCLSLHPLDFFHNTIFRWEKDYPHIPTEIIEHLQEVLLAIWSRQGDGTAKIPMNKLESFL